MKLTIFVAVFEVFEAPIPSSVRNHFFDENEQSRDRYKPMYLESVFIITYTRLLLVFKLYHIKNFLDIYDIYII